MPETLRHMDRLRLPVALPAGVAAGVFSLLLARHGSGYAFLGASRLGGLALLCGGYALTAAGLAEWHRRPASRFGLLLSAAGFAWFLLAWNNPADSSSFVFTVGLALYVAAPPLVAHAALAYSRRRVAASARAVLLVAYVGSLGVMGLLPALFFDPRGEGCSECPHNLLLVKGSARAYADLNRCGVYLGLGWTLAVLAIIAWKVLRASSPARRQIAPVSAAVSVYLGFLAAEFAHSLPRGFVSNDRLDRQLWAGQAVALVVLSLGVAWEWLRGRRMRNSIARLVLDQSGLPRLGGLQDVLSRRLGDPTLRLAYPLPDGGFVDAEGREIELSGSTTALVRDQVELAQLEHRSGLLDDPNLVEEVVAAAGLALENEGLQAETRSQLEDLRGSRARIIAAGDAERRLLERDLHDGAQQGLVALSLSLRLARGPASDRAALQLERAEEELRSALAELRELAHGIYPASLAEDGIAAALEGLAESGLVSVDLSGLGDERFAPTVEAAIYFLAADVASRASVVPSISVRRGGGSLVAQIDPAPAGDLTGLDDRIGALGGTLVVDGARMRVEIPCA